MTYQNDCTLSEQFLDQLCGQGLDALPELIRIVLNNAMHHGRGVCAEQRHVYLDTEQSRWLEQADDMLLHDVRKPKFSMSFAKKRVILCHD